MNSPEWYAKNARGNAKQAALTGRGGKIMEDIRMEGSIRLVPEGITVWAEFRGERIHFPDMWTARKTLDEFAAFGIRPSVVELADGTAQVRYSWSAVAQAKFARLSGLVYARGFERGRIVGKNEPMRGR